MPSPSMPFRRCPTLPGIGLSLLLLVAAPVTPASAWQQQDHDHRHDSPYADQEDSGIAALSLQELRDLESAAGMGLARAAELNHFPGPKHVLELADVLELSAEQRRQVQQVFEGMQEEALRLGAEIIEAERVLDRRFAHAHVDAATVREMSERIGRLNGQLRAVHLVAHLETTALLDEAQITAYDRARGYE